MRVDNGLIQLAKDLGDVDMSAQMNEAIFSARDVAVRAMKEKFSTSHSFTKSHTNESISATTRSNGKVYQTDVGPTNSAIRSSDKDIILTATGRKAGALAGIAYGINVSGSVGYNGGGGTVETPEETLNSISGEIDKVVAMEIGKFAL